MPLFWLRNAKKYDLLPLFWPRSDAPVLSVTICCRCFGLEVMPQCYEVDFLPLFLASK